MSPSPLERFLTSPWMLLPALWLGFFWLLGDSALYDLDEGAFTAATREMFERGNFVAPYLNGEPRYDKPILIYWLQAATVLPLGFTELAFRLPSALAAALWVLAVYRFGREFMDRASGVVAGLLLIGSLMVLINARAATADALLNLLLALSLCDIYRYYQTPRRPLLLRIWLWLALGLLTKGPVAVSIPLLASGLFFLLQGRGRDWLRAVLDPWGWLLFLGVTLPWLVAVALEPDYQFFSGFLLRHNLERFADTMEGHGGQLYYYLLATPLILWPFTGWLLSILPRLRADLADPLGRFLWIWCLTVLIPFSFSSTQLPHYMLYGSVPLLLLMAHHRERVRGPWLAFTPPLLLLGGLLILPDLVAFAATRVSKPWLQELLARGPEAFGPGYRWTVAAGLLAVLGLALWRRLPPWQGLLVTGFVCMLVLNGAFRPVFFNLYQQPIKDAGLLARQLGGPTVAYDTQFPSFSVYRQAVVPRRDPSPGELVFLRVDKLASLQTRYPDTPLEILYRRGGVLLLRFGAAPSG